MRVAIIGTVGVPACYGGFESLVENLLKFKQTEAIEYTIFCSSKSYRKRRNEYLGAKLEYIPLHANGIQSIPYDIISMFKCLSKFDVILILGVSGCVILPLIRSLFSGKIIVNIDGLEHKRDKWSKSARWFLKKSEKLAIKYSDIVIADNKGIQDYVKKEYNVDAELIAYGGDHVLDTSNNEHSNSNYLNRYNLIEENYSLTVCRIEPENNVHVILEAFSKSDEQLVFIGNWKRSAYGLDLIDSYSKYPNILLLDPIYDINILYTLRSCCKYYIHGHSAGGTNPSLVEAMFFNKPIIAFDVVYNRETTQNQALYFKDSNALSSMLNELKNRDLCIVGAAMYNIAKKNYMWYNIVSKYESLVLS